MKYFVMFFLALFTIKMSISQSYFNHLYNYNDLQEFEAEMSLFDKKNNLITIGSAHYNVTMRGIIIRKLDNGGNLQWENFIINDTLSLSVINSSTNVSFLKENELYIFGFASKFNDRELEYSLPVFIKYDIQKQEVIFKKTYRIPHSAGIRSVILRDEYIYAVGTKVLKDGFLDSDGLIMKLDLDGNLIWQKSTDFGIGDFMYEIEPLNEDFVISGAFLKTPVSGGPFLIKIDTSGNIIKRIDPVVEGGTIASNIEIVDNNIYYVIISEEKIFDNRTQLLIKYDENLDLQWDFLIPITSKYSLTPRRMEIFNEQIIIAGNMLAVTEFNRDVYSYAISLNLEGQLNWEHVYYYDREFTHHLDDIEQMPNGDLVFMGTVFDRINTTDHFTDQYLWLFRTDSLGCGSVQPACYYALDDYFAADTLVSIIEPQFSTTTPVQILGNPFTTNLQLTTNESKPLQLKFYNTAGQLFTTKNLSSQLSINSQAWPSGIYFMQVFNKEKLLAIEKVIKQY